MDASSASAGLYKAQRPSKDWRQASRSSSERVRCSSFCTSAICLAMAAGSEIVMVSVGLMRVRSTLDCVETQRLPVYGLARRPMIEVDENRQPRIHERHVFRSVDDRRLWPDDDD